MNPVIGLRARRIAFWLSVCYIIETSRLRNILAQPKVRRQLLGNMLIALAFIISVVGSMESIREYNHNIYVNALANHAIKVANASHSGSNTLQPGAAPSTIKPAAPPSVDPNAPANLIIPKIGVDASVVSVGLNASGEIGTPSNVYQTAWYDQSAMPDQNGAMLIDGHISSWTTKGAFYDLHKLEPGDTVEIRLGSGEILYYTVVNTVIYPSDSVDMSSVLNPATPNTKALNLISCFGDITPGTSEFNERIVVYTEQVQ